MSAVLMRFEDEVLIWSNASIGPLFEIWESFTGRYGPGILGSPIERVWRPSWEAINLANRSLLEFGDDFVTCFISPTEVSKIGSSTRIIQDCYCIHVIYTNARLLAREYKNIPTSPDF